ncbi:MAG: hypothetical protein U1E66_05770 [Rhodospirillales bacterium]
MQSADDPDVAAAAARVERLLQQGHAPADVAEARLALSRALDRADRDADSMAAARTGISELAAAFQADPQALAEPMRALVSQYLAAARRTSTAPDRGLLTPIATTLGGLVVAEDGAEEADLDGDEEPGGR